MTSIQDTESESPQGTESDVPEDAVINVVPSAKIKELSDCHVGQLVQIRTSDNKVLTSIVCQMIMDGERVRNEFGLVHISGDYPMFESYSDRGNSQVLAYDEKLIFEVKLQKTLNSAEFRKCVGCIIVDDKIGHSLYARCLDAQNFPAFLALNSSEVWFGRNIPSPSFRVAFLAWSAFLEMQEQPSKDRLKVAEFKHELS